MEDLFEFQSVVRGVTHEDIKSDLEMATHLVTKLGPEEQLVKNKVFV